MEIAIIGGGVIGLTAALAVQKHLQHCKLTLFTEKLSPETTGDVSAGLWTPFLVGSTPGAKIRQWSKVTHDVCMAMWKAGKAKDAGISLQPVTLVTSNPDGMEEIAWKDVPYGFAELTEQQLRRYSEQHGKKYSAGCTYVSFTCQPSKLLPLLLDEFKSNGGLVVMKKVRQLEELEKFDLIINCTGMDAKNLVNDKEMYAVRGQVMRAKAPWVFDTILDDSEEVAYIIVNQDWVILGGTYQKGDEETNVREVDRALMLQRCQAANPGLTNAQVMSHHVGLRPGRSSVRLEREKIRIGGKIVDVVHNYGHGGSGVTLCFGCAEEALGLVQEVVGERLMKHKL